MGGGREDEDAGGTDTDTDADGADMDRGWPAATNGVARELGGCPA